MWRSMDGAPALRHQPSSVKGSFLASHPATLTVAAGRPTSGHFMALRLALQAGLGPVSGPIKGDQISYRPADFLSPGA